MNQIVSSQTLLFVTCVEIGIIMGMLFDLIRISRKIVKHPNLFVQIEDFIFWIFCGLIGFYMLYINNYAAIRPFVFIGIFLGAVFYFASFSILFMKIAEIVIDFMKSLISKLIKLLLVPARWLIMVIKIPLKFLGVQFELVHNYERHQLRKVRRRWYHTKADLRTEISIRKNKK